MKAHVNRVFLLSLYSVKAVHSIIMLYGKGYVQIYAQLYWEKFLCDTQKAKRISSKTYSRSPKVGAYFQEMVTVNLFYCLNVRSN